jgi:hypothetical protein
MVAAQGDATVTSYQSLDENPSAAGLTAPGTPQSLRIMGASICLGAPSLLFGLIVGGIAATFPCTPAAAVGVGAATCTAVITACIFYNVLTLRPAAEAEAQAAPQVMMR